MTTSQRLCCRFCRKLKTYSKSPCLNPCLLLPRRPRPLPRTVPQVEATTTTIMAATATATTVTDTETRDGRRPRNTTTGVPNDPWRLCGRHPLCNPVAAAGAVRRDRLRFGGWLRRRRPRRGNRSGKPCVPSNRPKWVPEKRALTNGPTIYVLP